MKSHQPGALFNAFQAKKMKSAGPIRASGSFQGKSNTLGHGGRAAQLKARGVPGGVIGNLARAAQAAPGQKNYHGGKKHKLAPALVPTGNPASMAPFGSRPKVAQNPNSPGNYGRIMERTTRNAKFFGTNSAPKGPIKNPSWVKQKKSGKKRKIASGLPPKNFGRKSQQQFANEYGLVPSSSTRTRTKRKASKLDMEMAFKKKRSSKQNDSDADDKMKRKGSKKKANMAACA